ncbi:MAG: OmpA family protein [Bacteroidota bacterium]
MKRIFLIIALLFTSGFLFGQKSFEAAEQFFADRQYYLAIDAYKTVLKNTSDASLKRSIYFKIAESYRLMNFYTDAINWYEDAMANGFRDTKVYLNYGDVLTAVGELDRALNAYEEYMKVVQKDPNVERRIAGIHKYQIAAKSPNLLNPLKNEVGLNSQYSEYGPAWFNDGLLFSSNRKDMSEKTDTRTGEGNSDVYVTDFNPATGQFSNPVIVKGGLNTKANDGTLVYLQNEATAYIMQSNGYLGKGNINECTYKDGEWSSSKPTGLNSKTYSVGHPTMAFQGHIMYFVSDMPGGKGGYDIWMSERSVSGNWGLPVNLGDGVNTKDDEMFPYIIGDTMLFFSSNGYTGFGGLDIYFARKKDKKFMNPTNIGYPFNSPSDDFGIIIRNNLKGGYLCSNRPKGAGSDDIYSFPNFPAFITASGIISDLNTGVTIGNAMVVLKTASGMNDTTFSDNSGNYLFSNLAPGESYTIEVSKVGYFDDSKLLQTNENVYFMEYKKANGTNLDFALLTRPIPLFSVTGKVRDRATQSLIKDEKLIIYTKDQNFGDFDMSDGGGVYAFTLLNTTGYTIKIMKKGYWSESRECDGTNAKDGEEFSLKYGKDFDFDLTKIEPKKEIVLNNIYYDYAKATLRPESLIELDKIVAMMRETPNVTIELSSHTDARGEANYNMRLSQARAKSCVDYIVSQGIDARRLTAKGYGKTKLLITNAQTEDEHQKNRRTSFQVMKVTEAAVSNAAPDTFKFMVKIVSSPTRKITDEYFEKLYRKIPGIVIGMEEEIIDSQKMFTYNAGTYDDLNKAIELKKKIRQEGFISCTIQPYVNNIKTDVQKTLESLSK